jgi:hypothetical protein
VNREGVLDKHDFKGSDRLREELILACRQADGLFFTSRYLLGFTRLSEKVHKPMAVAYAAQIRKPNALIAVRDPRGSGKTTLCDISVMPWAFLQEPVEGSPIRGMDTRMIVVAPKKEIAAYGHVMTMQNLFEQSETYRELTHDFVIPDKRTWSRLKGLSFIRPGASGGPNIIPMGIDSIATGLHPTLFMCDDLIHEHNYTNRLEIARIKQWMIQSHNLTESEGGARVFIGNIWAINDPQDFLRPETLVDGKHIFEDVWIWERGMDACDLCLDNRPPDHQESDHIDPITYVMLDRVIKKDEDGNDVTTPPTEVDANRIKGRLDTLTLMAQYYNRPVAPGELQFDIKDLRHWEWEPSSVDGRPTIRVGAQPDIAAQEVKAGSPYFTLPRAGHMGSRELIPVDRLDVYILVDPAPQKEESELHSKFAISVEGCETTGLRQFHLDEYAAQKPPRVNLDAILDLWIKWWPNVVKIGIEAVAYQKTIGDSLLDRARDRNIHTLQEKHIEMFPRLSAEGPQMDRIRYTLMPLFSGGNYYIHDTHRILKAQVNTFGVAGSKHDLLDALSNINRIRKRRGRRGRYSSAHSVAAAARRRIPSEAR